MTKHINKLQLKNFYDNIYKKNILFNIISFIMQNSLYGEEC